MNKAVSKTMNNFVSNNSAMIKSIFLLILAVSGNFVGETLSCKTQFHMSNNMAVKHLVILMLIYFTLNFTSSETPHPLEVSTKTVFIWIVFVMFTKMTVKHTLAGFLVLIAFFVLTNLIDYKEAQEQKQEQEGTEGEEKEQEGKVVKKGNRLDLYKKGQQGLFFVFLVILVSGFTSYMMEKRVEYGNKFEMQKFLLGVTKCKSIG
jgi:Ca2+/Na+ antiporter